MFQPSKIGAFSDFATAHPLWQPQNAKRRPGGPPWAGASCSGAVAPEILEGHSSCVYIYTYIYTHSIHVCYIWWHGSHQYTPNVSIYNIHGSYIVLHISTMWGPQDISWFRFAPGTIVINTINQSDIGVFWTNLAILGASHCIYILYLVGGWPTPLKNMKVSWAYSSQYMEK